MNIIIVGCGRVGRSIAEQLNTEGHSIIVIDENPEALERIYDTQNVMAIQGNGATYSVLREAEIDSCDLLIAVTATDELNLYTCLLAKNAGVSSTIARVRNPEYISDVEITRCRQDQLLFQGHDRLHQDQAYRQDPDHRSARG